MYCLQQYGKKITFRLFFPPRLSIILILSESIIVCNVVLYIKGQHVKVGTSY